MRPEMANQEPSPRRMTAPWPYFDEEEIAAVERVLRSGKVNYWTGDEGRKFEQEYAAYLGVTHAIAVANGTVALELALIALGIAAGDEVVVPSRTYIASASCIAVRGAVPVVADVERHSGLVTADTIRAVLTERTRAIIVVHVAGWPCDMDPILALAAERSLLVIEDCAQAHGARYKGRPVGSMGHAAAFSFCQDKIMTTGGEGGLLALRDEAQWSIAWSYKDIGRSYGKVFNRAHPPGFRWLTDSFGTNWRLTELQAAIGRIQLGRLNDWVRLRRQNAEILTRGFSEIHGLETLVPKPGIDHAYYKYYAYVVTSMLSPGWDRDRVMEEINRRGVPCTVGSCCEIYREQAFVRNGLGPSQRHQVAKELGEISLMFLVHPTLNENDMEFTVEVTKEVMSMALHGRSE